MKELEKYFDVLRSVNLFADIKDGELESVLSCLKVKVVTVKKNEIILLAGSRPEYVGVVLSGGFHIVKEDYDGNRKLIAAITSSDIFAEALCCASVQESPVTVAAYCDSVAMLLQFDKILSICPCSCSFHTKLIENMLGLIARKNLMLQDRMEIISINSIRAKVLYYLDMFSLKRGKTITIPLNREELANYLCVERSALSHELSRMKKDGLIDYQKNRFTLIK